ncbi:hypothetical protein CSPHI_10280 [Corynebacterium sphenisci DSM 44792]|uniref:ABC transporter domain-containing protein n=1 Tax=Corynebacterium sphenisci DSM 44792 TaxID=1437874 RepID=A0A1L7CZZ7_9CORY|nr:ABC transporter ATP-binding protein [Corynebacterium sphenisci]APT91321.1 hypothetical protein CSPHI_10280 [Corynebacterium sphenisci DSM 44792]
MSGAGGRLAITGLRAGYPRAAEVLTGVELTVPAGGLVAVLGPSGCGKTTLLRVLAGLLPAAAGRIRLGDRVLAEGPRGLPPERRRVGLVPQDAALFPHLDVAGNVGFGLPRRARRGPRVGELLDLAGIADLAGRMPAELSGGQAARVALARALAPAPGLVLLDEPYAALDAALRARLRADVAAILAAAGTTAMLVTHDQDEALSMADLVAVLDGGRVLQCAAPEELYARPATRWVAGFVGDCATLPATDLGGGRRGCALGEVRIGSVAGAPGATGYVVVRPEQVRLGRGGVPARVTDLTYVGHATTYGLALPDGTRITARAAGPPRHAPGAEVTAAAAGPLHLLAG